MLFQENKIRFKKERGSEKKKKKKKKKKLHEIPKASVSSSVKQEKALISEVPSRPEKPWLQEYYIISSAI